VKWRRELSPFFELARVLVRFNHVARFIVNANHTAMWMAVRLGKALLVVTSGARAACGFGFARTTATTFDVFCWPQVTSYGLHYVLFDSAPSGSNYIDVWDWCLHAQTAPKKHCFRLS
jgi:hypothetical protein